MIDVKEPQSRPEATPARVNARIVENVNVELEALLGSAGMTVGALTALRAGDVVPLDAQLNQPVELRLNGAPVARGEIVAVGEKFGVRLTEIVEWPE